MVLFNGMPFQKDQLDPDDLETVTMHKILETTSIFQRAVYLVGAECSWGLWGERSVLKTDSKVPRYVIHKAN